MPKIVTTFQDSKGNPHPTLERATLSDLTNLLGNPGMATLVYNKRAELTAILAEHEAMTAQVQPEPKLRSVTSRKATNG